MKKRTLAFLYLGVSLYAFGGISALQWQYYAIVVPSVILLAISQFDEEE